MRGRPDARYLVYVCFKPGGVAGAEATERNVWKRCCGLGDRMRGIQFLTRIAAATKRVLLVWQESPAPLERFLVPGAIDWRLTPELGIDPARDLVQGATHFKVTSIHELDLTGTELHHFKQAVLQATDAALSSVGIGRGQPFLALHLRLGGQIGETNPVHRFSLGTLVDTLAVSTLCAKSLLSKHLPQDRQPAGHGPWLRGALASVMGWGLKDPMPLVLVTDNDLLRRKAKTGCIPPWSSPNVRPVHIEVYEAEWLPGGASPNASAAEEALVRAHVASLADFGILAKSACAVFSPSGFGNQAQLLRSHPDCAALLARDYLSTVERLCWLHDYVAWHRSMRGRPDARYLVYVCFKPGGVAGAEATERNVWKRCCGLGDRMRGIQFLTRIAAATKRVLLVWQESPAPLERFLVPGAIDWRLTPDLGIDPARDLVQGATHFKVTSKHEHDLNGTELHRFKQAVLQGFLSGPDSPRFVTVSTNAAATEDVGDPVPPLPLGPGLATLAQALFRLSPEVEQATDAALSSVRIGRGQPFLALHLRLGGQIGESGAVERFSLGSLLDTLAFSTLCAGSLLSKYPAQDSQPAGRGQWLPGIGAGALGGAVGWGLKSDIPHVLITDNEALRLKVKTGYIPPWSSPGVQPVHIEVHQAEWVPGGASPNASAAEEALVRAHVASLADFGILVKSACVVFSPSGFGNQAQLLRSHPDCAALLTRDYLSTPVLGSRAKGAARLLD
ncbi:hypothetical protein HYH03_007623 [Edaphochlamys debaryana]|uniref:Uncharacterized protein n=1 Tax=Edaphochlamys debaryana TaxID=47281 RepID=A0A835Y1M4_9CHLO|nr:hypothetical protein HYH03_007623 [Edaphochlamys debaryana]|eukprot:KAG2494268.1 hypothetical protein HYH03_007623 [Edaphochlamys debaryana]